MESDDKNHENFLKEWEIARGTLENINKHLLDLRKYGFTFITALMAAETLLIPTWLTSSDSTVLSCMHFHLKS